MSDSGSSSSSSSSSSAVLPEDAAYRTKKREAGKIAKAIKLGVVGDGTVGKTTLLLAYTLHAFLDEYTPTVFDNFSVIEQIDDKLVNVILWDTAGQEDYKNLRCTTYDNTDVFLLCFSVVHPSSFENIKWWLLELRKFCPLTPVVLLGTKIDLREDPTTVANLQAAGEKPISKKQGMKKAKEIKARMYLECSAKNLDDISSVFVASAKIVMDKDKKMWADVAKKAKKEDKKEAKIMAAIEKKQKKGQPKKKDDLSDPDEEDSGEE